MKTLARLRTRLHCRTYGCPRFSPIHALTQRQLFENIPIQMNVGNSTAQVIRSGSSGRLGTMGWELAVPQQVWQAHGSFLVIADL